MSYSRMALLGVWNFHLRTAILGGVYLIQLPSLSRREGRKEEYGGGIP